MSSVSALRLCRSALAVRSFSSAAGSKQPPAAQKPVASAPPAINENVPGLSKRCVLPLSGPLGPGASAGGDYKVPEYFCYDRTSYAEAEIEMASYRIPQPDAKRKD